MNCVEVKIKIEQIQKKYEKPCLKKNNRRKRQIEEAALEKVRKQLKAREDVLNDTEYHSKKWRVLGETLQNFCKMVETNDDNQ